MITCCICSIPYYSNEERLVYGCVSCRKGTATGVDATKGLKTLADHNAKLEKTREVKELKKGKKSAKKPISKRRK